MKRIIALVGILATLVFTTKAVDMQAPMTSAEAQTAYSDYVSMQSAYYTGRYAPDSLAVLWGDSLFARLNELMGMTCRVGGNTFSYNSLRNAYVNVDKDLNTPGNIVGYYDGSSISGVWDFGNTWNREHTWPQSKGANKDIPMGHDMQSVRPTSTRVNSNRGNTPYGESSGYYDPNTIAINHPQYNPANNGSYRGDAARVILYDYIVYGGRGTLRNSLYNGNAQLLEKLGQSGVFESIEVLLSWHEQDMPSLTEMVRNDGAENYQGNRNPFIDFPALARRLFATSDPGAPTGLSNEEQEIKTRKILRNGQILIIRNDKKYSILGM